jgi:hypothetical protein
LTTLQLVWARAGREAASRRRLKDLVKDLVTAGAFVRIRFSPEFFVAFFVVIVAVRRMAAGGDAKTDSMLWRRSLSGA